ncbi:glycosyltransferase [Lactobacillus helveticus]|uniref:Glycosyl transferase n=1 Tax=Lactobacillus helveticus CIRM-BIA 953 TaxID=1226335 RepID=U4QEP7_LACHE|nr:glycosyltransferase [Lactobacillus helveticus]NRN87631.1 putative glycosyltransferase EpsF [Lactobacillus helveticus]CDI43043.1 Putative glycosyl transferase [Lactobacillus helveticus CIRM-BIA 953]
MYRVLVCGLANEKDQGGIEMMVLNYYQRFNRKKIHFDFVCNSDKYKMAYSTIFKSWGSRIFYTSKRGSHPFKYYKEMDELFKKISLNYDCIWFNTSDLANITYLKLAKKFNIKRRIIHSHNSKLIVLGLKGYIYKKIHYINRKKIDKYGTDFWACSEAASKWMFPDKVNTQLVKNAVDINKYSFNQKKREKVRNKYNLNNCYVIGNVGRLNFQKNQDFILQIVNELKKTNLNFKVLLVGQGEDKKKLLKTIQELNLEEYVLMVGQQKDMQAFYSAFDLFIFPSRFEGLSVSLLEAQANGVPILASTNVSPKEIKINKNICFLPLTNGKGDWAINILNIKKKYFRLNENKIKQNFLKHQYDIDVEAPKLEYKFINGFNEKEKINGNKS